MRTEHYADEDGNFGDWKSLGGQLREHRIHAEGGLRIYYSIQNDEIVLLLISGVKSSQDRDIRIARERLLNHETRKK